jgi:hypothetical protein
VLIAREDVVLLDGEQLVQLFEPAAGQVAPRRVQARGERVGNRFRRWG